MLLRSVSAHVRDQNWTAIGIDLVIVVVGVFIGIQVSNWNEARKDATTREAYVALLVADGRELLGSDVEYDVAPMRSDPDLLPALSAVMRSNLLEVEWRGAIAEQAEELRGRLEGLP